MKLLKSISDKLGEISKAIIRFPITFLILTAIAVLNGISIETTHDFWKIIITLVFSVFCFITANAFSERFDTHLMKIVFPLAAALVSVGYYFMIMPFGKATVPLGVKTAIAVFALFLLFLWIPSIKEKADFNAVFMSVFKAFFTSAFFSAIIWGGISLIIRATDMLLIRISSNAFAHTANIIWVVWAPMLMLSLIPVFGDKADEEKVLKASGCPKFLEVLLSYVLVPLVAVYTVVLLLYMVKTVISGSWNNNLLEPLIISYCIAVLLLYILISRLENKFASIFRMVFPKILIPIALFQLVSSIITAFSDGIVYTRYFVIIFTLYSVICGILLSFLPVKKNGVIAVLAIVFAVICITPQIDAFSVSFKSQESIAENVLKSNGMLSDNKVTPKSDISQTDKIKLTKSIEYINGNDEINRLEFLSDGFDFYSDFEKTFGFQTTYEEGASENGNGDYFYYSLDMSTPMKIDSFDYMSSVSVYMPGDATNETQGTVVKGTEKYRLILNIDNESGTISIKASDNNEIISADLETMFDSLSKYGSANEKGTLPVEKMSFDFENTAAKMKIVFKDVSITNSNNERSRNAEIYVLYSIK